MTRLLMKMKSAKGLIVLPFNTISLLLNII